MWYWLRPEISSHPSFTNSAIALLTRSRRRADHAGQLFLREWHAEVVVAVGEGKESLGGAAGDVEEHRVGESFIGGAEAPGEDADDGPEHVGTVDEHLAHVLERDRDEVDRRERSCVCRAHPAVEHRHLAEERAGAEHRDHRLASIGGFRRDRDPAGEHDVETGGGFALFEDDVAAVESLQSGAVTQLTEHFGRQRPEEVRLVEHLLTCRHLAPSRLARKAIRAPLCRPPGDICHLLIGTFGPAPEHPVRYSRAIAGQAGG